MIPILHPITERLVNMFLSNPGHAVGLIGPAGAGKDYLSIYIASCLLDISMESAKTSSQIYILDSEDGQGIDEVRDLKAFLSLIAPGSAKVRRCILIRHPEMLRHEAQNALLKLIEEPPLDTVIVCAISDNQNILPTISSRLQSIKVLPITKSQATNNFPHDHAGRAYHISGGNIGLMQAITEKNEDHPMVLLIGRAKSMLRLSGYERLAGIDSITKDKSYDIPGLINAFYKVLHAALISSANHAGSGRADTAKLNKQIKIVLRAQNLIEGKVQPKIVLTWLFYSL